MGHQERLPPPRLRGRCGFGEATFAGEAVILCPGQKHRAGDPRSIKIRSQLHHLFLRRSDDSSAQLSGRSHPRGARGRLDLRGVFRTGRQRTRLRALQHQERSRPTQQFALSAVLAARREEGMAASSPIIDCPLRGCQSARHLLMAYRAGRGLKRIYPRERRVGQLRSYRRRSASSMLTSRATVMARKIGPITDSRLAKLRANGSIGTMSP